MIPAFSFSFWDLFAPPFRKPEFSLSTHFGESCPTKMIHSRISHLAAFTPVKRHKQPVQLLHSPPNTFKLLVQINKPLYPSLSIMSRTNASSRITDGLRPLCRFYMRVSWKLCGEEASVCGLWVTMGIYCILESSLISSVVIIWYV